MKKINVLTLFFGSVLLTLSCENTTKTTDPATALSLQSTVNTVEDPVPIPEPSMIIPVQEAEDMYHDYGEVVAPLIEKTVNVDSEGKAMDVNDENYVKSTRSLTVGYEDLKNYLAYIEQEADSANTEITGLRIYFGKYDTGKNNGRATVFLNPVKKYGKGGLRDDVAFAIDKSTDPPTSVYVGNCFKVPGTKSNQANFTMSVQSTIQSLAANDLPWRPPPTEDPDFQ